MGELCVVTIAACTCGSIFGDHCSPISDTTILSSTAAGCDHIKHVSTQIPYAVTVALCCFVGYLAAGFSMGNLWLTLGTSMILLCVTLFTMHRLTMRRLDREAEAAVEEAE